MKGMNLSFDAEGMENAFQLMDMLKKWGAVTNGARLISKLREEPEEKENRITTANILYWQRDDGRDIVTPNQKDINDIGEEFVDTLASRLDKRMTMMQKFAKNKLSFEMGKRKKAPVPLAENDKWANATMGECLRNSMKKYMEQASERLIQQVDCNGKPLAGLNADYAAWKREAFGFDYPVLKATGQITDALNPTGPGGRNIRLEKEVTKSSDDRINEWGKSAMSFGKVWLKR
ncbi:MAG: hypothetical protein WC455_18410 [Dehalococcoidia bacterium]|jgi:hypothetical protein